MDIQICSTCSKTKPLEDFAYNVKTKEYRKVCLACAIQGKKQKKAVNYTKTRQLHRGSKAGTL